METKVDQEKIFESIKDNLPSSNPCSKSQPDSYEKAINQSFHSPTCSISENSILRAFQTTEIISPPNKLVDSYEIQETMKPDVSFEEYKKRLNLKNDIISPIYQQDTHQNSESQIITSPIYWQSKSIVQIPSTNQIQSCYQHNDQLPINNYDNSRNMVTNCKKLSKCIDSNNQIQNSYDQDDMIQKDQTPLNSPQQKNLNTIIKNLPNSQNNGNHYFDKQIQQHLIKKQANRSKQIIY